MISKKNKLYVEEGGGVRCKWGRKRLVLRLVPLADVERLDTRATLSTILRPEVNK